MQPQAIIKKTRHQLINVEIIIYVIYFSFTPWFYFQNKKNIL